jgi:hypothetical protein
MTGRQATGTKSERPEHNALLAPATIPLRLAKEDKNQNNDKARNLGQESHKSKKEVLI